MARIRTIKPEFWTNERVMECSMSARLMFIGMWNFADDNGRLVLSAKAIKAQIFPSDDITSENILGMVKELSTNGLVLIYAADGKDYLQIVGWQHQRIDKPQPGKYPGPFNGYSENVPGMLPPDRKGEDTKVKEESKDAPSAPKRGHRLSEDWTPNAEDWREATAKLGDNGSIFELSKFRDYWKAQPGQRGVKLDWDATWRNWIRNARGGGNANTGSKIIQAADDLRRKIASFDGPPNGDKQLRSGEIAPSARLLSNG